jgi:hypothetical protein
MPLPSDLDKGGAYSQKQRVWFGPTEGWKDSFVLPSVTITSGGVTNLPAGISLLLIDVAATVTINLPSAIVVLQQTAYQPANGIERSIWIKDFGGNAAAFNITVNPFGTEKFDKTLTQLIIGQNRQLVRLYPLGDGTGWFVG